MSKKAIFVRLSAKPGMERELEAFLQSALPLAENEAQTKTWYAVKFDAVTFGIFDSFDDEAGRDAHINGVIASELMAAAPNLLSSSPQIELVDVLAAKIPA